MNKPTTIPTNQGYNLSLRDIAADCPYCHRPIIAVPLFGHLNAQTHEWEVLMACPSTICNKGFIGMFPNHSTPLIFSGRTNIGNLAQKVFSSEIQTISVSFIEIYSQSYAAEQYNLNEICGVGYRKALEFLIKDYAKRNHPDDAVAIEKLLLAKCIDNYVTDSNVKSIAKCAAWLGNDETHYVKKWEGKDINDLKSLIDLTVYWIQSVELTKKVISEMLPSA